MSRWNALIMGLALLVLFYLFRATFPGGPIALIAVLLLVGGPTTWLLTQVRLADQQGDPES